jgi:hypothetical protein
MKMTATRAFPGANRMAAHMLVKARTIVVGTIATLLLTTLACPVLGQKKADVGTLNDRAIKLSKEGMLGKAIEIWVGLLETTEAEYAYRWVFHKNVGRNFQKLGKLPRAWWHLAQAKKLAPEDGVAKLGKRIDKLEKKLTKAGYRRITVSANRLGTFMPVDDELANWYPLPGIWWFKPGYVQFKVRSADGLVATQSEALTEDTDQIRAKMPAPVAMGRLVVVASPATSEIRVDGELLGVGRVETDLPEGDHEIAVTLAGYQPFNGSVGVLGEETEEKAVLLTRIPDMDGSVSSLHKWHWIALGSSIALVGAGSGTYWGWGRSAAATERTAHLKWIDDWTAQVGQPPSEATKDNDWQIRVEESIRPAEITSYVLWGVGGAGLIASAIWILSDVGSATNGETAGTTPIFAPMISADGKGLTLQFSF